MEFNSRQMWGHVWINGVVLMEERFYFCYLRSKIKVYGQLLGTLRSLLAWVLVGRCYLPEWMKWMTEWRLHPFACRSWGRKGHPTGYVSCPNHGTEIPYQWRKGLDQPGEIGQMDPVVCGRVMTVCWDTFRPVSDVLQEAMKYHWLVISLHIPVEKSASRYTWMRFEACKHFPRYLCSLSFMDGKTVCLWVTWMNFHAIPW